MRLIIILKQKRLFPFVKSGKDKPQFNLVKNCGFLQ